jgi:predicted RNase H-like HicB family nuclease
MGAVNLIGYCAIIGLFGLDVRPDEEMNRMKYTTLVTHHPGLPWRAVVPGLPDCSAEAPTRAEVLEKIQARIVETVAHTEVVHIEAPASPRNTNGDARDDSVGDAAASPWQWFGAFQEDTQWGELFEAIETQRVSRSSDQ